MPDEDLALIYGKAVSDLSREHRKTFGILFDVSFYSRFAEINRLLGYIARSDDVQNFSPGPA
jgi:hypothetical protein